jgi:SAM-dependent methyltransferase
LTPNPPLYSPAAERNREPILQALRHLLPPRGLALEIASGTGQHVAHFAAGLPGWVWQPSDAQPDAFESIEGWCAQAGGGRVNPPIQINVMASPWPGSDSPFAQPFDAIFCANMLHISPWATCAALMQGAARYLAPAGLLLVYGPFLEAGQPTAPGNQDFDQSLRQRDPSWGIRQLDDVAQVANHVGLRMRQRLPMPANNLLLVFDREPA